ncbi:MAG: low molecular weight protein-tyrosine-phosphatase [Treponema sp.]
MIKVLFVCHGNICRSPMAESVFTHLVKERGMQNQFEIASAATSTEEIGNPPHSGTVQILAAFNIPLVPHRAVQMTPQDALYYDYIIGMDSANIRNIEHIAGFKDKKICKLLSFAGSAADIADPWYTGNFTQTYRSIKKGLDAFLRNLAMS